MHLFEPNLGGITKLHQTNWFIGIFSELWKMFMNQGKAFSWLNLTETNVITQCSFLTKWAIFEKFAKHDFLQKVI